MTHNFFAGPAILPQEVLAKASESVKNLTEMGLSILEISHRSEFFANVMTEAEAVCRRLLNVSDDYAVLFLTGGASSQFFMAPLNILPSGESAAYIDTGAWSTKAIKEAKHYGNIVEVGSSKDANYNYLPEIESDLSKYKYLHLTSNNTIFGTQYQEFPDVGTPLVCDMSSDIFSRPLDVSKFDIIYAGAQKNMGPAGTTLVIIKKSILGKVDRHIPTMLNYETHIAKGSSFNTPPVLPIYVSMLTMQWVERHGGVAAMKVRNEEKATLLYNEIDRNSLFKSAVSEPYRSKMNVTFLLNDESHMDGFLAACKDNAIVGIEGHRSVGGFRASIYNAMELSSVQHLVDVMKSFEAKNG